jgi:hypothetical protein
MSFLHLMQVPEWLMTTVSSGRAYVDGAVVKSVESHQILAHLQPTQGLLNQLVGVGLDGGPLSMVSDLASNVQLMQLTSLVEQVQRVATIGAAASVLNLGVSVGGFALVLRSLNKLDGKVDGVARQVSEVLANQHADFMGKVQHALRRAEEAYGLSSMQERVRYWREADAVLAEVTEATVLRMNAQGLALEGQAAERLSVQDRHHLLARPEVLGGLRLLTAVSAARSEALLCLGEPGAAIPVLQRAGHWLQPLPGSAKALAQERLRGHARPPSQIKAAALQAQATSILIEQGQRAAEQRAHLCGWLSEAGYDTTKYMQELRHDHEPRELVWVQPDTQHMLAA